MTTLRKYNGQYCLNNLHLSKINQMILDTGDELEVNVSLVDKRHITDQQRKFIFAYLNDICDWTGEDSEYLRAVIMQAYQAVKGMESKSLMQYSQTEASELIDTIIEYGIQNGFINVERANEYEYSFNERQTYSMCLSRTCCICGKRGADIHHVDQIGTKGNRDKISHIGLRALPLCRYHHTEFHQIGKAHFEEKYNVSPVKIDKKLEYFIKKGKLREYKEIQNESK